MPRVRVVTERDVRRATKDGTREIDITGAVVTPSARDVAAREGVTLKGAKSAEKSSERRSQGGRQRSSPAPSGEVTSPPQAIRLAIAVGADHGGVGLRDAIAARLRELGHAITDHGTTGAAAVDYP